MLEFLNSDFWFFFVNKLIVQIIFCNNGAAPFVAPEFEAVVLQQNAFTTSMKPQSSSTSKVATACVNPLPFSNAWIPKSFSILLLDNTTGNLSTTSRMTKFDKSFPSQCRIPVRLIVSSWNFFLHCQPWAS